MTPRVAIYTKGSITEFLIRDLILAKPVSQQVFACIDLALDPAMLNY